MSSVEGAGGQSWVAVFKEAVKHVLKSWTVLNLAVDGGWGGKTSEAKRFELYSELLQLYAKKSPLAMHPDRLADWLAEAMLRRFCVVVEDESDLEVAEIVCRLYATLSVGDFSYAEKVSSHKSDGAAKSRGDVVTIDGGDACESSTSSSSDEDSEAAGEDEMGDA